MAQDLLELHERRELAEQSIGKLEIECQKYISESVRIDFDPIGTDVIAYASVSRPVPTAIKVHSGNILSELRSILDALACLLAERNGKNPGRDTYFPITKSEDIFLDTGLKHIRKLSDQDKQKVSGMRPYAGGNDTLHALHVANNMRKHQRLNAQAAGNSGAYINGFHFGPGISFINANVFGQQVEYATTGVQQNTAILPGELVRLGTFPRNLRMARPVVDIAFSEPAEVQGQLVCPTLRRFSRAVGEVVSVFD